MRTGDTPGVGLSSRRKIGVMGGTFDPIHLGHLIVADEARHQLALDEIVFVPAAAPWQKQPQVDASHRLAMVRLAVNSVPGFSVSDVDISRGGNTYTVDTLSDLRTHYRDAELLLLIGTDALNGIHTWKEPERIATMAQIVCLARPGYRVETSPKYSGAVTFVEVPAIDISSTDCRQRCEDGRPFRFMLPEAVYEYIEKNDLYRRIS